MVALGASGGFCLVIKYEFIFFFVTLLTPVSTVGPQVKGPFIKCSDFLL
jgi:hypothetical protein